MESATVLTVLKFTSFIIAALSGVWALITKTTFEDEQGRKRLTAAGHMSVAIIIAAALVGMLAFGFETLTKQDADRAAEDKQARLEQRQQQEKAAERAERIADRAHRDQLAQLAEANRRADAAEQRGRALDIAQRVSRGTADNLARAEVALRQLGRLLNPLGVPEMTVVWVLPRDTPGTSVLMSRLAEAGERLRRDPQAAGNLGLFVTSSSTQGNPLAFQINSGSSLFPSRESEPELYTLLANAGMEITLYGNAQGASRARMRIQREADAPRLGYFGNDGDLAFGIEGTDQTHGSSITISYNIEERELAIWISGRPDPRFMRQTGHLVSISDLERASLAVTIDDVMVPSLGGDFPTLREARKRLRPDTVFLRAAGREYVFRNLESVRASGGSPVFFSNAIGSYSRRR